MLRELYSATKNCTQHKTDVHIFLAVYSWSGMGIHSEVIIRKALKPPTGLPRQPQRTRPCCRARSKDSNAGRATAKLGRSQELWLATCSCHVAII